MRMTHIYPAGDLLNISGAYYAGKEKSQRCKTPSSRQVYASPHPEHIRVSYDNHRDAFLSSIVCFVADITGSPPSTSTSEGIVCSQECSPHLGNFFSTASPLTVSGTVKEEVLSRKQNMIHAPNYV